MHAQIIAQYYYVRVRVKFVTKFAPLKSRSRKYLNNGVGERFKIANTSHSKSRAVRVECTFCSH